MLAVYSPTTLLARLTRSFVEKPVTASRNFRNRLLVSMITVSGAVISDSVSMMIDLLSAPIGHIEALEGPGFNPVTFGGLLGFDTKTVLHLGNSPCLKVFGEPAFDGIFLHNTF